MSEHEDPRLKWFGNCLGCGMKSSNETFSRTNLDWYLAQPGWVDGHVIHGEVPDLCGPVQWLTKEMPQP